MEGHLPQTAPILILEPDEALQALLDAALRHEYVERVLVPDGVAAVRASRRRDFAAFIIDVSLAPSSLEVGARRGEGFLHYLRDHRPALLQRVIVLSGLAAIHIPKDLPPVRRFLPKPFDIGELRSAVDDCLAADATLAPCPAGAPDSNR
jgi:DNA-binding NtrC family response regulator